MKIQNKHITAAMVLISFFVLAVKYEIFSFGSTSINTAFISIENIKINDPHIVIFIIVILLAVSLFIHTKNMIAILFESYRKGYKESNALIEHVGAQVKGFTGTYAHGSPYGSFKPSIRKKDIDCGRFTSQAGLTSPLTVEVPTAVHLKSLISGLREVLRMNNIIFEISPLIIGFWALIEIVI